MGTKESCTCEKCQAACRRCPGRFLPGEVEKVAEYLGISLEELFKSYLRVCYNPLVFAILEPGKKAIFSLSPATTREPGGQEHSLIALGRCIFYDENGLCKIHLVKPFSCREALLCDDTSVKEGEADVVEEKWRNSQDQIRELLGRKPNSRF